MLVFAVPLEYSTLLDDREGPTATPVERPDFETSKETLVVPILLNNDDDAVEEPFPCSLSVRVPVLFVKYCSEVFVV